MLHATAAVQFKEFFQFLKQPELTEFVPEFIPELLRILRQPGFSGLFRFFRFLGQPGVFGFIRQPGLTGIFRLLRQPGVFGFSRILVFIRRRGNHLGSATAMAIGRNGFDRRWGAGRGVRGFAGRF